MTKTNSLPKSCCLSNDEYIAYVEEATDLSPNSVDTYVHAIERAQRIMAPVGTSPSKVAICSMLMKPEATYATLSKVIDSRESLKTVLTAFMTVINRSGIKEDCKAVFKKWYDYAAALQRKTMSELESNEPTERQRQSAVKWEQVEELYTLLEKTKYGSKEHVMLAMYVRLAMRRQEDYCRIYVYQTQSDKTPRDQHGAYIDLTESQPYIRIRTYKTAKAYDDFVEPLSDELIELIKYSLEKQPRNYLIAMEGGEPYREDCKAYTRWVNATLKRLLKNPNVSLNSLRHARATWSMANNFSVAEQKAEARRMGHSHEMHALYKKRE